MTPVDDHTQRKFTVDCWNGMVDSIQGTLASHPDAVAWREPNTGGTGLYYAIAHGSHKLNIAEILLAAGADIDCQNGEGVTALMVAAGHNGFESVEWLLDRGAKLDVQDQTGKTAQDWARVQGHDKMAAFLEEYGQALAVEHEKAERAALKINAERESAVMHKGLSAQLSVRKPMKIKPR